MSLKNLFALVVVSFGLASSEALADKIYVHAVKAELKAEPKAGAQSQSTLTRGTALEVLKAPGQDGAPANWYFVKTSNPVAEGWISKLFVRNHPPVGQSDLEKDVKDGSIEKHPDVEAPLTMLLLRPEDTLRVRALAWAVQKLRPTMRH